jgi:PAS domain S-box-containing protein
LPDIIQPAGQKMREKHILFRDLIFPILFAILLLTSFLSYQRIVELNNAEDLINRSYQVKDKINQVLTNLVNAETGQRGYLLTKDSRFLQPYYGSREKVQTNITDLKILIEKNEVQQKNIQLLLQLADKRLAILSENIDLYTLNSNHDSLFIKSLQEGKTAMDKIRDHVAVMLDIENDLLAYRKNQKSQTAYLSPLYSLLLSVISIAIAAIAFFGFRNEMFLRNKAEDGEAAVQALQKATKESEILFRAIADSTPVLIWLSGIDKQRNFFNKGWLDFTGRTMEGELGNGWTKGVHPEDLERCLDVYVSSFDKQKDFHIEYRLKRHDGTYRWIADRAVPRYSSDGVFLGYAGGCMDIEEQKNFARELEKRVTERTEELNRLNEELSIKNNVFANAEENAMIGSYQWNLETGELSYSDNLFRIFGCEPQEFVPTFEKFLSFIHPDDKEQVIKDGKETFESQTLVEHVYRVVTKQGQLKYCRSSGNLIDKENTSLMIGTVQDISKDTMLRNALAAKNLELERNNEELESFSYITSHDLQEPLRKIRSFSNLILSNDKENLLGKSADYFTRIVNAAERMQNLIEALLSYSNANKSAIRFLRTDLNELLAEVQDNFREKLLERNGRIESSTLPILNVIQLQFLQLFTNIIGNAIKYAKKDVPLLIKITTKKITVEEGEEDATIPKGKYYEISIADNGIGFEQEYAHKIFELFQRLHGRTEYTGTGIGLAICKKIMNNHNGFITASGTVGVGAVFNLYLPLTD